MEKLKNIPSLRFPEFEENWEVFKLGDVMNFKVTNSFSRENLNYDYGDVKNIHYGDIHTKFQTLFDIAKESVPFLNEEVSIDRISDDYYCKEGDIIFADASEDINDVGKSIEIKNLNGEKLLSGLHTLLARPIENKFVIGFNGYLFKSNNVRVQIQKESQGSKVLSINVGRILGVDLSFPTLPEQTKIASFLTAVDEKLQALKQKKTLLEQYKKGVMQKIFSQELRFKDDTSTSLSAGNGNEYADWEEKKLGDIGKFYSGGTPLTTKRQYFGGNIPFIRSGEINSSKTEQFITEEGLKNSSAKMVAVGDILYALYGATSGEVGISKINGAINQAVLCIISNENHFYLYSFLKFEKENIIKTFLQGGQGNLSADIVKKINTPIPCIEEQTKIANFLTAIDDKINYCQVQIEKTELWKKGLLQQMFC
jgi:type I restriction enzyme S subunit